MRSALCSLPLLLLLACGPKLPPRYVVESDIGAYKFRRYQQVLDVELSIEGNPAVGHTATYVRGGKTIRVAPVFVTVYREARGLTETARQRLRALDGYHFEIEKAEGEYVYRMNGQAGDQWLLWVSGPHLIKLGAPEGEKEVPRELLALYLDEYPSDFDAQGKARAGRASAGEAVVAAPDAGEQP